MEEIAKLMTDSTASFGSARGGREDMSAINCRRFAAGSGGSAKECTIRIDARVNSVDSRSKTQFGRRSIYLTEGLVSGPTFAKSCW